MGNFTSSVKRIFRPVVRFVKRVIKRVVKTVKRVVKKVIGTVKSVYKRYIKPWAGPIIKFAKNCIPGIGLIRKGIQVVKNGVKMVKNGYKACRNYFSNKPYKKYFQKAKQYGKNFISSIGKSISNSTFFGKVYNIGKKVYNYGKRIYDTGKRIYNTGKRIYTKAKNTYNFLRNSFYYVKNRNNKDIANRYLIQMKKNWKSSFLSGINYKKYINQNYYNKINNSFIDSKNIIFLKQIKSKISEYNAIKDRYLNLKESLKKFINKKREYVSIAQQYENFSYEVKVLRFKETKTNYPYNYCRNCSEYCCQVCRTFDENGISLCTYFNGGRNCPKCKGKCPRDCHIRTDYFIEKYYVQEKKVDEAKKRYYDEYVNKIRNLENEFNLKFKDMYDFKDKIQNLKTHVESHIIKYEKIFQNSKNGISNSVQNEIKNILNVGKKFNLDISYDLKNLSSDFNGIYFKVKY